jgi:hypothetical protein
MCERDRLHGRLAVDNEAILLQLVFNRQLLVRTLYQIELLKVLKRQWVWNWTHNRQSVKSKRRQEATQVPVLIILTTPKQLGQTVFLHLNHARKQKKNFGLQVLAPTAWLLRQAKVVQVSVPVPSAAQ